MPKRVRIGIRWQLAALVLMTNLVGLSVVIVATWITNHNFVLGVAGNTMALTASLKAAQIASSLLLVQSSARSITTRVTIQNALVRYNTAGSDDDVNWASALDDLVVSLNGGRGSGVLLQAKLFSLSAPSLERGGNNTLVQATGSGLQKAILLPHQSPSTHEIYLGDPVYGYPSNLYPNLSYTSTQINNTFNTTTVQYGNMTLDSDTVMLLGPFMTNETYALMSMTMAVRNQSSSSDILGWMTIVADAGLVIQTLEPQEGLESLGVTLLVGPTNSTNKFPAGYLWNSPQENGPRDFQVRFVLPPNDTDHRHSSFSYPQHKSEFNVTQYPAVKKVLTSKTGSHDNAGYITSTTNEQGIKVAVGYAMPNTAIVDWAVIVEQSHSVVWQPINHLRDLLIICVFSVVGFLILLSVPVAHYSSAPIRQLRDATRKTVAPPKQLSDCHSPCAASVHQDNVISNFQIDTNATKRGFLARMIFCRQKTSNGPVEVELEQNHEFRIPCKVKNRRHLFQDELSDLTGTFNEMCDELVVNYERLEDRVKQRTAELEESKTAAEAANEMKTLFVANISHELKTPLNGIIGIAQTAQAEANVDDLKRDMRTICSQGDLLRKLIEDILSFSKNQVAGAIVLEGVEFKLNEIKTQVHAVFDRMAKERNILLAIGFEGAEQVTAPNTNTSKETFNSFETIHVKDMTVWGDKTRILQVIFNLTSNALKFTPANGNVEVMIRCLREGKPFRVDSSAVKVLASPNIPQQVTFGTTDPSDPSKRLSAIDKLDPVLKLGFPPADAQTLSFEFEVRDSGLGIPVHLQQKIFEPFFQADNSLRKKYGGTGLGLSICQQLATLLQGSIVMKSVEGKGSIFTLRIPLKYITSGAESTYAESITSSRYSIGGERPMSTVAEVNVSSQNFATPSTPKASLDVNSPTCMSKKKSAPQLSSRNTTLDLKEDSKSGGREMKILLAEDNKTNQLVAVRMLLMEKITNVDVAADGRIALDMVIASIEKQSGYDIILMDVQMPNMDGLEATRFIREKGFKGPIIALSAYADAANVKNCKDAGMDDFVSKPIQLAHLRQVLKYYCPVNRAIERSNTRMQDVSAPSSYYMAPATSKGDNTTPDTEDG